VPSIKLVHWALCCVLFLAIPFLTAGCPQETGPTELFPEYALDPGTALQFASSGVGCASDPLVLEIENRGAGTGSVQVGVIEGDQEFAFVGDKLPGQHDIASDGSIRFEIAFTPSGAHAHAATIRVQALEGQFGETTQDQFWSRIIDVSGEGAGDEDGDGFAAECGGEELDCDDSDPTAYPGAEEICDGIDTTATGSRRRRRRG